ncbi:DDE-domain-containing protein, partial [Melanomma pulvis-pyrius CBS 109.77]
VELLFLPAHSSHVLQPLDLTGFSVVKSKYRHQIRKLSALDNAAPVKKKRFITCYDYAREEGLSERVIRAGWQAAGICPFNKPQDLYYIQRELQKSEIVTRKVQIVLRKAGKALSAANTQAAELQAENLRLQSLLSTTQLKNPRKRVQVDPN